WWIRRPAVAGAVGGLAWGVLMRLWMRFISVDPEFTWSGTGFILVASILAGVGLGFAYQSRRTARTGWWRLFGLPVILLGAGAGMIMLPGVVIGGLAFGRRDWPRVVRIALYLLAAAGTSGLLLMTGLADSTGRVMFGWVKTAVVLATFGLLHTIEMAAAGLALAPRRSA
ncbi:MAG TPA: hypothetical protein VLA54_06350, partial [Acidimicrobiia bacterium]|nr:hypothetical protein [Acidimicrobiia bacterium]